MHESTLDVSVVLATRNRAGLLEATLGHFARLYIEGISWEVIVVDNNSTDATPAVLERAKGQLPLTALHEPRPGKNHAINRALAVARGELLIFTDDDIEPDTRWISEHVDAARRWPAYAIFGGPVVPKFPPETPQWIREHPRLAEGAFAAWGPAQDEGPGDTLPYGANFAIRARRLSGMRFSEEMGTKGADTDLMGGETELLRRLHTAGERVIFVPSAPVRHVITPGQLERRWLLRRWFRIGRTAARLDPDDRATRLLGAPYHLWRSLIIAWLRRAMRLRGTDTARFDAALADYWIRGALYEYLAREEAGVLARMLHP